MKKNFIIQVSALILLISTVVFFLLYKKSSPTQVSNNTQLVTTSLVATTTEQNLNSRVVPDGMREYKNITYRFSLLYPQELVTSEHPEGGGATTITFQNIKKVEGFQIFIVPYVESQVSDARFKEDVPSGVRTNLTNITVDGVTGATFYSTNITLGETKEIWFIRGGYLFEVTTLKSLDAWLSDIMQSWKFL